MDLRIIELWSSRELGLELEGADAVAEYHIQGTTDEEVAYAAVEAFAPTFRWGLRFRRLRLTPIGGPHWTARVEYGVSLTGLQVPAQGGFSPPPPPPPAPAGTDALTDADGLTFSTLGETVRVNTSVATLYKVSLPGFGPAPDFERRIGVNGEGVDVFSGRLQLTYTRNMPALTLNYIKTLRDLTGKVNEGTWRGVFADSSCLFLGAEGQYRGPEGWVVTYQFDVGREDVVRDKDGTPLVAGTTVPPHHYAWYLTEKAESEGKAVDRPVAVYVEQVYEKANLDALGL